MSVSQNGWPTYEEGTNSNLVAIPKILGRVRKGDVAWIFTDLVERYDRSVEDVDEGRDDWGFAPRPVRGGSEPSNHASGTAIDINAVQHGIGLEGTFSAKQEKAIQNLIQYYKGALRWGGSYDERKDEMHWEINVSPSRLAEIVSELKGNVSPTKTPAKIVKKTPSLAKIPYSKSVENVQRALRKAGYYNGYLDGIAGPMYTSSVKSYQNGQKSPFSLYADGNWGSKTQAHFDWVKSLQTSMNKWYVPSGAKLFIDGDYGNVTISRVRTLMKRHHGVRYKGAVDGKPGQVFCTMIGIKTHP